LDCRKSRWFCEAHAKPSGFSASSSSSSQFLKIQDFGPVDELRSRLRSQVEDIIGIGKTDPDWFSGKFSYSDPYDVIALRTQPQVDNYICTYIITFTNLVCTTRNFGKRF